MRIELEVLTIEDALRQLGYMAADVEIRFRRGSDYGNERKSGAIIEFRGEIPKEFESAYLALEYIRVILTRNDLLAQRPKDLR